MKKVLKYIGVVASVALMSWSCDVNKTPVFDDADAFVGFGSKSFAFSEQAGKVQIPVTLASIEGITTSIAYAATDDTAVAGTNYSLVDPAATLAFSEESRTAYIEIDIIDVAGVFTGDLKFSLSITNSGSVNTGSTETCEVTIEDQDHPLSAILGTYTVTAKSYFDGDVSFDMTISKDAEDVTMVYFANIAGVGLKPGYYGVVNAEMTEIVVPLGQIHPTNSTSSGDGNIYMYGISADLYIYDEGNMIFNIVNDGTNVTITSTEYAPGISAGGEGYYEILLPPYTAVKK